MSTRDEDQGPHRGAVFNRRLLLLGGAQLAAFGLIGAQLYRLQVREGERLASEGRDVITRKEFILPERGAISDRSGRPLAFNRTNRVVNLRIRNFPSPGARPDLVAKQNLNTYADLFALDDLVRQRAFLDIDFALGRVEARFYLDQVATLPAEVKDQADFVGLAEQMLSAEPEDAAEILGRQAFVTVEEGISLTRGDRIRAATSGMPLIELATRFVRRYEAGETDAEQSVASVSHVLGYTRRVFREDLFTDDDPLLSLPGARIGARGIEKAYDRTLRGIAGSETWQITGGGRKLEQLAERSPTKGEDLTLTIDLPLQNIAVNMISQHAEAAAVVMDVNNGEILAMASQPAYNVNDFVPRIGTETYNAYLQDEYKPLFARASQGQYPPGSTFKMVVTLAAQIHGFAPSTTWTCPGFLEVSGQRFRCWKRRGHGDMDMYGALRESCDVWFYQAAQAIGVEKMRAVAAKFGFGEQVINNFQDQSSAVLPSREWKERTNRGRWVIGDSIQFAIGQGFVTTTPVQLAAMTAAIANGGYAVTPHLVRSNGFFGKTSMGFDPRHIAVVKEAMNQVVNSDRGTAKKARLELPLGPGGSIWRMAGKTGTAQVSSLPPDESEEVDEERPYDLRDHALFVCYAPLNDPKFACAVVVEHGGSGSATAAPLARDLLTATLARYSQGLLA